MHIRVLVKDEGVAFDYSGFEGESCLIDFENLLRELEKLGINVEVVKRRLKTVSTEAKEKNLSLES